MHIFERETGGRPAKLDFGGRPAVFGKGRTAGETEIFGKLPGSAKTGKCPGRAVFGKVQGSAFFEFWTGPGSFEKQPGDRKNEK